jgi:iron(III) transport system substrate-binding protein
LFALLLVACAGALQPTAPAAAQVVNVYSARTYGAMEPVFSRFTRETGIEVRLSSGSVQSLLERLKAEGPQTPADLFLSIDAGGLWLAAQEGLLQPVESQVLTQNIPPNLRDPENRWFGLTQRVRTIVYNPAKVAPNAVPTSYEALADPTWKGRLCLRPATHIYTLSLVSSIIAAHGPQKAEEIVTGWVANQPQFIDSDTRILETLAAGSCDAAITNHYYLGRELQKDPSFPIKLAWANQADRGVHVNISGVGVTAGARNKDNAVKLIEWLADAGQTADESGLPGGNFEFPVRPGAPVHPTIQGFGPYKPDPLPIDTYGRLQPDAIKLLERAGYR